MTKMKRLATAALALVAVNAASLAAAADEKDWTGYGAAAGLRHAADLAGKGIEATAPACAVRAHLELASTQQAPATANFNLYLDAFERVCTGQGSSALRPREDPTGFQPAPKQARPL
ncbi:hypothetical protein [Ramlibacter sp. AN1133]|uniref:hypothetical protein n=1 Tax=Ramlibacter sp. AN1133 TaxID=3133429 RepID=UPI0030C41481